MTKHIQGNKIEEEIWLNFCRLFRGKLKEITNVVALHPENRTYDIFSDVITNVILLEINLDKKPWEEIPKREIKFASQSEVTEKLVRSFNEKQMALSLREKLESIVSYNDTDIKNTSSERIAAMGLYSALDNYIKNV